ncbi:MAG: alpha-glucosidase/alpha-galactosidase [Candidatus Brockarchaeota archaeon]|nr:alpha-glucosidase/alpha-galactosidase [Candidatus Brockarchaeota archaeon]
MKISIIGAGSVRFTQQLIGDIAQTEELSKEDTYVYLMDINRRRLDNSYILAKKYVEELNSPVNIVKVEDMNEAIDHADFVINTAYPYDSRYHEDGFQKWETVTEIGEKHGYYRGIDSQELNMVSTYTYILASYFDVKLALDIASKIKEMAPNAYLMQTANPVFEITQAVTRWMNVKIVGFCHGVAGVYEVFRRLGLDTEEVDWQVAGVNHGIWLNRFRYKGGDAYPLLDKWIEENADKWESKNPWDIQMSPAAIDMYKFYGMLPIGDTVRNGTWKYHYNLETKKKWFGKFGGIDNEIERPRFHEQLRRIRERLIKLAEEVQKNPRIMLTERAPDIFKKGRLSGEQHIPFINAIVNNKKTRLFLNVENKGAIKDFPDDIVMELPVWVDKDGLHRENIEPDLTERIKKFYLWPRILKMEWNLEAFISRDRRVLEEILIRDPRTKSYEQVVGVLSEILSLPFNEEIRKHYRI